MFFADCISTATTRVLDWDLPAELLPLTATNEAAHLAGFITNEAAHLAGFDSDSIGAAGWY